MRRILFTVVSMIVTAAVFFYLFLHIRPAEVVDMIAHADPRGVLMFMLLSMSMSVFRTWRFLILLRAAGHAPGRTALFLVVLVRNVFSDLLPARLGTLIYIVLVTTRLGVPGSAATSSFSISFLLDILVIAPMVLAAVFAAGSAAMGGTPVLVIAAVALGGLSLLLLLVLPRAFAWAAAACGALPTSVRGRCERALLQAGDDVREVWRSGLSMQVLVLSVLVRVTKYASLYVFLFALVHPLGYGWDALPLSRVFLGICAAECAASLPISGIGGFGAYEGAWTLVFRLLGYPVQIAMLTSVAHHLFTQVYGYGLGALALLALLLPVWKPAAPRADDRPVGPSNAKFLAQSLLFTAMVIVALIGCYRSVPASARPAFHATAPPEDGEESARRELRRVFPGRVLFDSNRSGSFGIYSMWPDGTGLRVVADSSDEEMYPDPSRDGQWIVYARAVSTARLSPSDIWICRADGSGSRRLVGDGTFPTFSEDGSTVYFERNREQIVSYSLQEDREEVLFPGPAFAFGRHQVVKPRVSPGGDRVVFISDHPSAWQAWAADLNANETRRIGQGCEPVWLPDGSGILWLRTVGAKERSGIFRLDLESRTVVAFQDADAPWGHEYFPTVTRDGRFLMWSSCPPGQHSHTDANYQIFCRDLDGGSAVRITFDGFTNRWPKQLVEAGHGGAEPVGEAPGPVSGQD